MIYSVWVQEYLMKAQRQVVFDENIILDAEGTT